MRCDHAAVDQLGSVAWCQRCGAVRVGTDAWRLSENEQDEVHRAEACSLCEVGDPVKDDYKIWRWSCGHWIDSRTTERIRREVAAR